MIFNCFSGAKNHFNLYFYALMIGFLSFALLQFRIQEKIALMLSLVCLAGGDLGLVLLGR